MQVVDVIEFYLDAVVEATQIPVVNAFLFYLGAVDEAARSNIIG